VPVQGERVSGGFFQTLSVRPMLGRDFYPGEDRPGGPNVVILSYGAWLHRFGTRGDLVGQTVDLDNEAYTIIGVLPARFPSRRAATRSSGFLSTSSALTRRCGPSITFGESEGLRDGVTAQAAGSEVATIAKTTPASNMP